MDLNNAAHAGIDAPQLELDTLRDIAETLARGEVPSLAEGFTWRGQPCARDELEFKLGALSAINVTVLDAKAVSPSLTSEIAAIIQAYAGVTVRDSDSLGIVTAQFGQHIITWGLLVGNGELRAWFDPAQLLQLLAP